MVIGCDDRMHVGRLSSTTVPDVRRIAIGAGCSPRSARASAAVALLTRWSDASGDRLVWFLTGRSAQKTLTESQVYVVLLAALAAVSVRLVDGRTTTLAPVDGAVMSVQPEEHAPTVSFTVEPESVVLPA